MSHHTNSQLRVWNDNGQLTVQIPCKKSRASSIPLCEINIYGHNLASKTKDLIRLYLNMLIDFLPDPLDEYHMKLLL